MTRHTSPSGHQYASGSWEHPANPGSLVNFGRTALIVITTITAIAIVSLIAITPHIAAKAVVENEGKEE